MKIKTFGQSIQLSRTKRVVLLQILLRSSSLLGICKILLDSYMYHIALPLSYKNQQACQGLSVHLLHLLPGHASIWLLLTSRSLVHTLSASLRHMLRHQVRIIISANQLGLALSRILVVAYQVQLNLLTRLGLKVLTRLGLQLRYLQPSGICRVFVKRHAPRDNLCGRLSKSTT